MKKCCKCGTTDPEAFTPGDKYKCRACRRECNQKRYATDSGRLNRVWNGMMYRCGNPRDNGYRHYGGRGIRVEFRDFEHFRDWALSNGYQAGLEIDRRDNDGHYSPENCRFVTREVNMRNTSRAKHLEAFGELKPLGAWAEDPRCVVTYDTLYQRTYRYGWDPERALSTPARDWGRRLNSDQ